MSDHREIFDIYPVFYISGYFGNGSNHQGRQLS